MISERVAFVLDELLSRTPVSRCKGLVPRGEHVGVWVWAGVLFGEGKLVRGALGVGESGTHSCNFVQLTLDGEAEAVQVQIVAVVSEGIFTVRGGHVSGWSEIQENTHISCPISRNPRSRKEAKAVALIENISG